MTIGFKDIQVHQLWSIYKENVMLPFLRSVLFTIKLPSNMLSEGISPALIENSGVYAGMAVGPFAVNDEVGIDLSHHIGQATKAA